MRTFRVWLLILLAVLLPVRGAVAAAMLCPPAGEGRHAEWSVASEAADHHVPSADHVQHEHADPSAGHHADASTASATCNLCCDFCSMTLLPSAPPSVETPQDFSSISFPDLAAPAPSFLSSGPERPPRSI